MLNLLQYKVKKIVAKHGYLNKSDLTAYEIKQLDAGNNNECHRLADLWDDFLKAEADPDPNDRDQTS